MTKILVTGASGYIAKHIILQLLERGDTVRGSLRDLSRSEHIRATMAAHVSDGVDLAEKLEFVALHLTDDAGWDEAMQGIDVLLHTASPVAIAQPKNENELIKPAMEGTLRALKAAQKAGVKRVVMTSSVAAIVHHNDLGERDQLDERDWNDLDPKHATAYSKSKTYAERAAWDYIGNSEVKIDLTTINPGVVLGAPLDDTIGASVSLIERIMQRKDPAVPHLGFACVDVRDVAKMHVTAMDAPVSFGKRYIAVDRFVWFSEFAEILATTFPERNIITRRAPNWLIKILAMFDADLRSVSQDLGVKREMNNLAAQQDLNIKFREIKTSAIETAQYFVAKNLL